MKSEGVKQPNQQENKSAKLNPQSSQQSALKTPSVSHNIMQLQKTIGNRGVLQLVKSRKLTVAQMAFANAGTKTGHFGKHGGEFGSADENAYEASAEAFTAKADSGTKQSKVRANGDTVHFDSATDEFSIVTPAGNQRTYFKPDPAVHKLADNQAYYDAQ